MAANILLTAGVVFLTVCRFAQSQSESGAWGYSPREGLEPPKWQDNFPACGRSRQSPINIDSLTVIEDTELDSVKFIDYDEYPPDHQWVVENNGHTVKISANFPCPPQLHGGSLHAKYQFMQIHFHWAHDDYKGSEHHLDGRKYPLEMHLVHRRRNRTPKEISEDAIGLAVVAVFFELGNSPNRHLTPITEALKHVEKAGTIVNLTLQDFTLKSVLPQVPDFFRYNGSLTTPPCDATVQWTVMRQPIRVSHQQLLAFRALRAPLPAGSDNNNSIPIYITDNFRPVQDLAGRTVYRYRSSDAPARLTGPSLFLLLISLTAWVAGQK
ncbi:putative Carbonic anhydrase 15 [Hypsibius exemplaris]|uniref:Carbonic anhydrase n=1 Tax=Hypsibius exemplaris TaxID=2072580 RepID=A0A1W0XDX2_HYPEX|nr:putative Carbonic anhydrase 15 [Hypsibius exemplaris]